MKILSRVQYPCPISKRFKAKYILGWGCSFPVCNSFLIPASNLIIHCNPGDMELLFYSNPEYEFEFYPNCDLNLFYPNPKIEFYPIVSNWIYFILAQKWILSNYLSKNVFFYLQTASPLQYPCEWGHGKPIGLWIIIITIIAPNFGTVITKNTKNTKYDTI